MELIAVLENPNYIINIGHVIRNVNALGVDQLFVVDGLHRLEDDLEVLRKRKTLLKHSSGAVQFTRIRRFDTAQQCLDYLSQNGFLSIGTSPHGGDRNFLLHDARFDAPKLAIWFGDEANGLTQTVLDECAFCVTIAMRGAVESLNLATTTGIVLHTAVVHRQLK